MTRTWRSKLLAAILLTTPVLPLLWLSTPSQSNVPCSVPFNLQNGVTADANQVMANYNAILTCLTTAAAAGANSDITSLLALSTPLPFTSGGSSSYVASGSGQATGAANAIVVSTTVPTGFTLTIGKRISFISIATNTSATTINVNSTGVKNVFRRTQLGASATVGGEIIAGQVIELVWDGLQFELQGEVYYVGKGQDWFGTTAPPGWAFADGSCQLRAGVFADLFSVIGTTYDPTGSTCDGTHFAMPDGRGRMFAGRDNMGGTPANRITNAATSCVGTTLGGAGCGSQTTTLTSTNQLPPTVPTGTFTGSATTFLSTVSDVLRNPSGLVVTPGAGTTGVGSGTAAGFQISSSGTPLGAIAINSFGTSAAIPVLNPIQIANKVVKY